MLYLLFLLVIAFRDEELAYPWTYSAILGAVEALALKIQGKPWSLDLIAGFIVYLYLGFVFMWLSRASRFSLFWWLALFFATLPITAGLFLSGAPRTLN
jgi:hypothetical protein